jgi:hypothetical protein
MTKENKLIDFKDLISSVPGEGLEQLVRQIGIRKDLQPEWSGRGADGGRDLFFTEIQSGVISKSKIKWLISCKDKATSEQSVGEDDLPRPGISDKLIQHKANGFLLVTTTTVSTAAKAQIDSLDIKNGGNIFTKVWDSSELITILLEQENHDLLQQFLPESFKRVKGLTTLEGAIYSHKDLLPDDVLTEVLRLVKPYSTAELKGSKIWSFDSEIAEKIDSIVKSLLIESDLNHAITLSEDMDYDAYLTFVTALHKSYPDECFNYLWETVVQYAMSGLSYNAFYFLADNYKLTQKDLVQLAPCLDDEFTLLDNSKVFQKLEENIMKQSVDYELNKQLIPKVDDPVITNLGNPNVTYYVEYADRVDFMGEIQIDVSSKINSNNQIFSALFDGYFDEENIFIESVYLKGEESIPL